MQCDWLWGLPRVTWEEQEAWVAERLAADPAAAAIDGDEAEAFMAVSYVLRFMSPTMATKLYRAFGVRLPHGGQKGGRAGIVALLRQWKYPISRERLLWILPNSGFKRYPDPVECGDLWTEELFYDAFHNRANIVWLVRVRRQLGKADNLSEWFDSLADWAEAEYRMWINVARLTLRRIVYPEALPHREAAAAGQATAEELRAKDRLTSMLRQNVRQLEQDRKQLKARARQVEQRTRAMLSQARGEVAAARKALKDQAAAHEQELAAQSRRFEQEMKLVRNRLSDARKGFVGSLTELATHARRDLLQGRSITVSGCRESEEACRLLIESVGGTLVSEGGEITLSAAGGLAALERELRNLALQKVLIKCDGLYRRKEGRHGVAVAGLQVHAGEGVAYRDTRVVNCGPLAGSLMAEYGAVVLALNWLLSARPPAGAQVVIWSDCRSLLSRLRRRRDIKRKRGCVSLDAVARRAVWLLRQRGCEVQLRWVPRDEVHAADRLCDSAYRKLLWYHRRGSRPTVPLEAFLRSQHVV